MEKRKKVLIVDGDEQVLMNLEHLLEDEGIDTTTTWSARQALELLRSAGFDCLLMGDHLPDLSCEQLLREIQGQGVPASILVMESATGRAPSAAEHFACLGAAATVRKQDFGAVLHSIKSVGASRVRKQARAA